MKIKTKFKPGDKAWIPLYKITTKSESMICSFCNGKGYIYGYDTRTEKCPVCRGNKNVVLAKYVPEKHRIDTVHVIAFYSSDKGKYLHDIRYEFDMTDIRDLYNGNSYDNILFEENVFKNRKACKKICSFLNKEI